MPAQGKNALPPPPGGRRAPPPPPTESEEAPPPLPSRPTPGKPGGSSTSSRNGPLSPSASSDSSFQDEEYEEPGTQVSAPPPLPPHPNAPKSIKQPSHRAVQEPQQEEEYSELDGVGMVDQGPPSPTADEPEQEEYDEFEGIVPDENEPETYEAPGNQQDTYEEVPQGKPAAPKLPPSSSKVGMPLPAPPASSNKNAAAPGNMPQETYEEVPASSQPSVPTRLPPSSGKTGVPLPPPPSSEFIDQISGDTYETLPDQRNRTPTPPPPPPSVPSSRRPVPSPSATASEESIPEVPDRSKQEIPKNRAASGMPLIGQDQLNSARMGLKQTTSKPPSVPSKQEENVQSQGDFRSTLQKFKHKEQGKVPANASKFSAISSKKGDDKSNEETISVGISVKERLAILISEKAKKSGIAAASFPVPQPKPIPPPKENKYLLQKQPEIQAVARPKSPTIENDEDWGQEEIYDDALSKPQDPLIGHKWFKDVGRQQANSMVKAKNMDGAYMVRTSSGKETDQPYSLVVLYKNHVYNLKIRHKKDGRYALGEEKSDELTFKDVPDLIQHHTKQAVMLVNNKENKQYETILTVCP